ncbi:DUF5682 family protein [Nannocystis radixulma]|uniref:DUF5682 family protein n=1 Tax=Nannocystis radixulma TaxID=2995305 RepID=A0ABT5BC89_9BACT|nr:DUF5682 family protein [Nannocystis radixulma]MDC0671063.1 DUF5682 family protein [Nannocystis radixulma]
MNSILDPALLDPALQALRTQLEAAAAAFAGDSAHLGALLRAMIEDVQRATAEPVEVFPVKHHSPASALHMLRRLRARAPKVIYMEGCEDLNASLAGLHHCRFPVALQAYAPEAPAFPVDWTPLNVVLPLTEFSAEYQAIAYCLQNPGTKLVFVDRSVDHVFQWMPRGGPPPGSDDEADDGGGEPAEPEAETEAEAGEGESAGNTGNLHGGAVGLQIGAMQPTFGDFLDVLLRNAKVRHYSEWWTQYVEGPTLACDYGTYRQVFFLVGSLLRRIGITEKDRVADCERERYMWTRIREHMKAHKIDPREAMYVCGAIHAVSPIPEFGSQGTAWTVPAKTPTQWFYGVVPSSYAAIERQFSLPAGEISIAQSMWDKGLQALDLKPFKIEAEKKADGENKPTVRKKAAAPAAASAPVEVVPAAVSGAGLRDFLTRPPTFVAADDEQLMRWCVEIVRLARKNGYTSSTADTIAILHTATLLARLRDRPHPSPYDFQDAAVTCLEKDRVPGRRDVRRLCQILLGGDRLGRVGYESLPPLAQDVYDRLAVLGINLKSSRIERALLDIQGRPELLPASDLLWRLRYLGAGVRPIMGERTLGHKPKQESWDIEIGKHQSSLIQLGYEGLTIEQVLEKRLKTKAFEATSRAAKALEATEDSVFYLRSGRLTRELGMRATELLRAELGGNDAPEIFQRVRGLVHYYRTLGMPDWIKDFVSTGYRHYATLLPTAFTDRGTAPRQLAAMLAFIFTQEALAFSMGCERSQLLIAVAQAEPDDPPKIALRWAAQWILGQRSEDEIRADFQHLLHSPLLLPAFPEYMAGFLLALEFTPRISRLAVEFLSRAFAALPDEVLVPWLPKLVVTLRPLGSGVMQTLVKEAGLAFPRELGKLGAWEFAWDRSVPVAPPPAPKARSEAKPAAKATAAAPAIERSPAELAVATLLRAEPATLDALAGLLGVPGTWTPLAGAADEAAASAAEVEAEPAAAEVAEPAASAADTPLAQLLAAHPEALQALAARLQALA